LQSPRSSLGDHLTRIKDELKTLAKDPDILTNDEHKRAMEQVRERYLAMTFLATATKKVYWPTCAF